MVGPAPVDLSLSDEDFAVFSEAFSLKIQEEGLTNDAEGMNYVMQEWWHLLIDIPAAQSYVNEQNLDKLKTTRDRIDTQRTTVEEEITRLETITRSR